MPDKPIRVGTFLPTSASPEVVWQDPASLAEVAQQVEGNGFDGLWVGDHYLTSPVHGESWHDPLTLLAYLAGRTSTLNLGPAIMVTPVRHPVWLAKQIASVQYLSQGRFSLAMATGFSNLEFGAVEIDINERGPRQNEILDILQRLLGGGWEKQDGRFYHFPELVIEPRNAAAVPILIAGGSQPDVNGERGVGQRVIDRIARSDGWVTPTYAPVELIAADWRRIVAARTRQGRSLEDFTFAHMNFVHVVDTNDDEVALAEQKPAFMHHFGDGHRPWELIRDGHFLGGIDTILASIHERVDAGCDYICLQPILRDRAGVERQIQLIADRLMPRIRAHVRPST